MMIYILVVTDKEKEHMVYSSLSDLGEVDELFPLFGEWDLIFRLNVDGVADVGKIVDEKIKTIDGVLATKTLSGY